MRPPMSSGHQVCPHCKRDYPTYMQPDMNQDINEDEGYETWLIAFTVSTQKKILVILLGLGFWIFAIYGFYVWWHVGFQPAI